MYPTRHTIHPLLAAILPAALLAPDAHALDVRRASLASNGFEVHGASFESALSGDGRFAAFASYAADLVPNDTNGSVDVFVHDLTSGLTERVSIATGGGEAHGDSRNPSLSFDGRYVAFDSNAPDLVPGDTNGTRDVFVHDRATGETTRASVRSGGLQAFGDCFEPDLSDDGSTLCYWSFANDLIAGDTLDLADVFFHDRRAQLTLRVSQTPAGVGGDSNSHSARISGDGGTVVFASSAANLGGGRSQDVFAWTRANGALELVSVNGHGGAGDGASYKPDVSADGRFVVFESEADNLIPNDRTGQRDVFLRDRANRVTLRVSDAPGLDEADGPSRHARMSGDGRTVVYESAASNLLPGDTNNHWDVYLLDLATRVTERISLSSTGVQVNQDCVEPAVSDAGRRVAFHSSSAQLVPQDQNGLEDVFVVTRPGTPALSFCTSTSAACPCGNVGQLGRGCENSIGTGGGLLDASGSPSLSADTLRLQASGLTPSTTIIFFQGSLATPPMPFGDGILCLGGGIRRLGGAVAVAGSAAVGAGVPGSSPISVSGTIPAAGVSRWYQGWYRNAASFCTPAGFNLTSGLRIDWLP